MTVEFALDYIPRRMRELGYGDNYITRWRHLQLDASSSIKIDSSNEYYILITPSSQVAVRSKLGVFDLTDIALNEMQYEHRGKIQIRNNTHEIQFILFIQVIPNHS
jgi:hypothetical protein